MSKKVAALTLGCKVNMYDTEAMLELFANRGYETVGFDKFADIYIVNTCTVTNLGNKKSRQMLRRARKQNLDAIVIATGCYAQVSPEEVSKIREINLVVGTKDRLKIVDIVEEYEIGKGIQNKVSDVMTETAFERLSVKNLQNRTRAYLKIQEGCNQYCSYCIIPYARGRVRSRDPEDVIQEVKNLAANGYKEVVLVGIHVASYGKDLVDTSLLTLLKLVHDIEGIKRIRFSSIEPNIVTDEFIQALRDLNKICSHFHLSLQSGCDRTLKRMNRKYNTYDYEKAVIKLREARPGVAITTDIIAGFPGETDEDYKQSYEFIKKINFAKIHVFPYSPKEGTPAAKYPEQVNESIKNKRVKDMLALGELMTTEFLSGSINNTFSVLYETKLSENYYIGHTENYMQVKTLSVYNLINDIKTVKITNIDGEILISEEIGS